MDRKEISQAVIQRLPRYYRYLEDLMDQGIERISSGELSKRMHLTASQIRQEAAAKTIRQRAAQVHPDTSYPIFMTR